MNALSIKIATYRKLNPRMPELDPHHEHYLQGDAHFLAYLTSSHIQERTCHLGMPGWDLVVSLCEQLADLI